MLLEKRMAREYGHAAREMAAKQRKAMEGYGERLAAKKAELDGSKEAAAAFRAWCSTQVSHNAWLSDMAKQLASAANSVNRKATEMINDALPAVYAENANWAAFGIEKAVGLDTSLTLVNEEAVRHLMGLGAQDQLIHEVIPYGPARKDIQSLRKNLDSAKDIRWNRQKFTSAITQGILQGESVPNIVRRTTDVFGMNRSAAVRAVRTACTSAENAGRMVSFERAERMGIDMEVEWLATIDSRTRESHVELDGERIGVGETFSNGLRYPGDPAGAPEEVYNCRCRANGRVVGFNGERGDWADETGGERWSRLPAGVTYEDWKRRK